MKKVITAIAAGFASVLACVGAASAAQAQPAPRIAHPPVVYSQPGWRGPQVKPRHFYDITGDSSEWLNTASWRYWTGVSASSAGRYGYRTCFGSCDKTRTVPAAITVWRVRSHHGRRYFTRLRWVYKIKGHQHTVVAWFDPTGRAVLWVRHK